MTSFDVMRKHPLSQSITVRLTELQAARLQLFADDRNLTLAEAARAVLGQHFSDPVQPTSGASLEFTTVTTDPDEQPCLHKNTKQRSGSSGMSFRDCLDCGVRNVGR